MDSDRDGRPDWNDADSYIGSAGGVATGPGEVTVLALLVSVLTALMYMSYTHTDIFRRHEAEQLGERQGPMDFRQ